MRSREPWRSGDSINVAWIGHSYFTGRDSAVSLLLLIDGYNVIAPTAPPTRSDSMWLHRERAQLLSRLAQRLPTQVRQRTCVVFDAANPPPGAASEMVENEIDVRYSVDHAEADDLIEELISAHSAPRQLAVVSSDQRIQTAARRRSARPFDSQQWFDDLLDGKLSLSQRTIRAVRPGETEGQGSGTSPSEGDKGDQEKPDESMQDVDQWMKDFGF